MQNPFVITALLSAILLAAPATADPLPKPTDPQIAHIAYTAGVLDIEAAKQALDKSKNKDVLAFRPADGRGSHVGEQSGAGPRKEARRDA